MDQKRRPKTDHKRHKQTKTDKNRPKTDQKHTKNKPKTDQKQTLM